MVTFSIRGTTTNRRKGNGLAAIGKLWEWQVGPFSGARRARGQEDQGEKTTNAATINGILNRGTRLSTARSILLSIAAPFAPGE